MQNSLENTLKNIPENPGCYQFVDKNNVIIYVGKAKNLKKRVNSYFNKTQDNLKTRILVKKIANIKYIIVDTEEDTLLLENNLIKELQPRYNILLKDDKTYASIVIKNEYFPRIVQTRNIVKDGSNYFGPYTSGYAIKTMLDVIHKLYPLRSCNLALTPETIAEGKYKVCLDYHIKKCLGPCESLQTLADYNTNIESAKRILQGDINAISKEMYTEMMQLAEEKKFEEANWKKEKYDIIEKFKIKTIVVGNLNYNIDVYSYGEDEQCAYINYLHVHNGAIIQAYNLELKKKIEEEKEILLGQAIVELRNRFGSKSKEIVLPFYPDILLKDIQYTIPQRGDKVKLLDLSIKNVNQYKLDKLKQAETLNPEQRSTRILNTAKKDLRLKELPIHIECFDNSNIQGTNPVSACVVFKRGKPSKRDYRHFNVKTVVGPDDYLTMKEVLTRRYSRLEQEDAPLPQLIVIDGGKGQLGVAVEVLKELNLYGKIAVISIAEKLEEIYYPNDPIPLYLDKNSETLKLIQHLRDEAHRFGLSHHRQRRSKEQVKSELDNIKGIGIETKKELLQSFKSIKRIKEAKLEELENVIGKHKANLLVAYFAKK